MALQTFLNAQGTLLTPTPHWQFGGNTAGTGATLDAAGESSAIVGYVRLSSGPGTSKVLSAAGSGKIHVVTGAVTFNNGSTNLRVGVNDVGATGLEDGTHDVFADLTGGGGGIAATTTNSVTMTSGSKTIAHGDLIAVVVEMTARGGADSVVVARAAPNSSMAMPYATIDTGSGPTKNQSGMPMIGIEFDDGTVGWMDGILPGRIVAASTFAANSTPDEYALVFQVPFRCQATGLYADLSSLASTDDFELILYSDPLGTPVAERTITQDMDLADAGRFFSRGFSSVYTLEINTNYAIALRPTTNNSLAFITLNLGTNGANIRKMTPFGTTCSQYTRSNQSGAFGSQDTTVLPCFGVWVSAFDDAVSAGGGFVGIIGGV